MMQIIGMKISQIKLLDIFGSASEIVEFFGGKTRCLQALSEFEYEICRSVV
ncbi:hypothetical protein [bacterium endosymbiont of Bathymodiolus sp. 5 South]|jgi:hypothetical protein|uniref:hypothetical protein n=1 Tax=bacterium endosymbiont of Bathymodiolus sp. 5 South TaxID=1181670 RepID=UPI00125B9F9E|nr:hypothetical protein [bacterium endosymbiont of Bathymodiolus sp. 5 South]VVH63950.1 hypothetical protein BSPWISOX_1278 [uncultured Gammaproteobacteria bacterium]